MKKRFFLSTRKDRAVEANALSDKLRAHGWERTYEWKDEDGAGPEAHAAVALAELEGVRNADVLVVLLPGGFGTHVEIGAALALGKPVILHSPDQQTLETPYRCVFHYHPKVELIVSQTLDTESLIARMTALTEKS